MPPPWGHIVLCFKIDATANTDFLKENIFVVGVEQVFIRPAGLWKLNSEWEVT